MKKFDLLVSIFAIAVLAPFAQASTIRENERMIVELMLSHKVPNLKRALEIINVQMANASRESKPRWMSLAGLCELEIAAAQASSQNAQSRRKRGLELLLGAANSGDANAAMTLSDMYRYGEPPLRKDLAKSQYWNERALQPKRPKR